jgi:hypothetical protein
MTSGTDTANKLVLKKIVFRKVISVWLQEQCGRRCCDMLRGAVDKALKDWTNLVLEVIVERKVIYEYDGTVHCRGERFMCTDDLVEKMQPVSCRNKVREAQVASAPLSQLSQPSCTIPLFCQLRLLVCC